MISAGRQVPNRLVGVVVSCLGFVISIPGISGAQSAGSEGVRAELFVSTALGVVFHGTDDDIPVRPNIGGGVAVRPVPRVGVEFEVNQNLGRSQRWGSVGVASANVLYFFAAERPRAYVSGGIGALWSDQAFFNPQTTTVEVRRATGLAWNIGLGIRIPIGRAISFRPEFRGYSNADLRIFRTSIAVGYHW